VAPGGDWSNPESFSAGQKFPAIRLHNS